MPVLLIRKKAIEKEVQEQIRFEAMINLAPRRKNRSMMIQDPAIRAKVETVVRDLLEVS